MRTVATSGRPDTGAVEKPDLLVDEAPRTLEDTARRLETTGLFRVLRRLEPRPIRALPDRTSSTALRVAIVLDTETTGLDPEVDEIVELAMIAATYDEHGLHDVVGRFTGLHEPSKSLTPQITSLTGLTLEDLRGHQIDPDAVAAFIKRTDVVIAHNAEFDREFCRRRFASLSAKTWLCSYRDIDWRSFGAENSRLSGILGHVGLFHTAHRAMADCDALVEILAADRWSAAERSPFASLLASLGTAKVEIIAGGPTYAWRDQLKGRGYRWSPGTATTPKGWFIQLAKADADRETVWLSSTVYAKEGAPIVRSLR
ncbi:3'-5' exonuclease [Aureimonas sp. SK2]|uniref:3'-5' exonuclease n=1 Tax=Aureimonas sp. SK2 TaxID=3015992 RepID=UPI002443F3F8|nr:3'-5' exonuclease [Aureimonas sp. SK2]